MTHDTVKRRGDHRAAAGRHRSQGHEPDGPDQDEARDGAHHHDHDGLDERRQGRHRLVDLLLVVGGGPGEHGGQRAALLARGHELGDHPGKVAGLAQGLDELAVEIVTQRRVGESLRRIHDGPPIPGLFIPFRDATNGRLRGVTDADNSIARQLAQTGLPSTRTRTTRRPASP